MLERERELATIAACLDAAVTGAGSLMVAEGPAGIGKSTLLSAAAAMAAERGMGVLQARGGVLEQRVEFGIVRQLVERELVRADPEQRERLLAGPAAPAASALGMGEPPRDGGPAHDPSPDILHGLHWVVANLAEERPLLLAVDDAQWGDAASLRAGGYLANRLDGLPVAMLVCLRDDEASAWAQVLAEMLHAVGPAYLRPEPLTEQGAAAVLTEAFGDPVDDELVAACVRASGGNPFYLSELATELAASGQSAAGSVGQAGPPAVTRSLLLRLGRLGPAPRRLAEAVATLGGEGELRHAAAIAGLDAEEAAAAADRLVAAKILAPGRPLRIVHPLVRAAIADQLSPSERAAAHRGALAVLREDAGDDHELLPHALEAEATGDSELVALLRRTAARALATGSPESAAVQLDRALAEPPPATERGEVLAELGGAEVRQGAFEAGIAHLEGALPLLGGGDSNEVRVCAHRDRLFAALASGGMEAAQGAVRFALADLGDDPGELALALEADLALLAWLTGADHGLDLARHGELRGATEAQRILLAIRAQEAHSSGNDPDAATELAERALGGGRLVAEDTSESLAWYMSVYALLSCEAHEAARSTIADALADARRRGSAFAHSGALGARAVLALNEGRPRDAEADAREAAAAGIPPVMAPVNAAYLVLALVDQGELEDAEAELVAAGLGSGPGGPTVLRWIPWARARLREAQGEGDAVREAVVPLEGDDDEGRPMRALAWRALLARSVAPRAPREAAELAAAHLRWAVGWGRPAALGVAERASALAAAGEERIELLGGAVETLASSASRTEEARARLDAGIAQLRAGRRREGREGLEAALEVALACGARGVARRAAEELEVAGASPRRISFDELTASERRVAERAAAGSTNREIAEELFVTPKTVENHLTRAYAKLGVSSRRELAAAL